MGKPVTSRATSGFEQLINRLGWAGNTDNLIPWERLAKVEPLTERELCSLVVRIANREPPTAREINQLAGIKVLRAEGAMAGRTWSPPEELVEFTRTALSLVVHHRARARMIGDRLIKEVGSNVALVPEASIGSRGTTKLRLIARDARAGLAYGVLLLLDPSRQLGVDLCQCRLDSCGQFFWAKKPRGSGRPRRHHCSDAHRLEDRRNETAKRVRKWRDQQRRR